jgi:hypothetical protein
MELHTLMTFRAIAMKRFRLSTLMLLVVIVALTAGLVVQSNRSARRETELRARLALAESRAAWFRFPQFADAEGTVDTWSKQTNGK